MKNLAVVLLSGGMDSMLCAAIAKAKGYDIACLHFNYKQRTEAKELKAFNDICDHYDAKKRLVVDVSYFAEIGGSSLTDKNIAVEKANLDSAEIPSSYVPFRNGNLLAIAASWAEAIGAKKIFIGAIEQDSSGYPDCRESFLKAFEKAINLGTKDDTNIELIAPLVSMTKKEIVLEATRLNAPIHLTWSCYEMEDKACGVCDSCALRLRGFREAGVEDPIDYNVRPNY